MRAKNLNPLERIEREEVNVTGDNTRRMAVHCKLKKLVVFGVAAGRYV